MGCLRLGVVRNRCSPSDAVVYDFVVGTGTVDEKITQAKTENNSNAQSRKKGIQYNTITNKITESHTKAVVGILLYGGPDVFQKTRETNRKNEPIQP